MLFKSLAIAFSLLAAGIALILRLVVWTQGASERDVSEPVDANPPPGDRQPPQLNTALELERLLAQRLQHPETAETIDAQIHDRFVETHAILVLDSSGFSRISHEQGVIVALAEIERMRGAVLPIIAAHQGSVFKIEVDNVYAVFPAVELAIAASNTMIQQMTLLQKHISIGIGYGQLIMISAEVDYSDVYGEEMNLASKLGEDLAGPDEVLLTEAAFEQIGTAVGDPEASWAANWDALSANISGLQLRVYKQRANHRSLAESILLHPHSAESSLALQTED